MSFRDSLSPPRNASVTGINSTFVFFFSFRWCLRDLGALCVCVLSLRHNFWCAFLCPEGFRSKQGERKRIKLSSEIWSKEREVWFSIATELSFFFSKAFSLCVSSTTATIVPFVYTFEFLFLLSEPQHLKQAKQYVYTKTWGMNKCQTRLGKRYALGPRW